MAAPSIGTKKLVPNQRDTVDALEAIPPWRTERIYMTRFVAIPLKAMLPILQDYSRSTSSQYTKMQFDCYTADMFLNGCI